MQPLSRTHEKMLAHKGYHAIAGVDEAGRGALAGPIVAAAVIMSAEADIPGVQDSKRLTEDVREELYPHIIAQADAWAIAMLSEEVIDRDGVQRANLTVLANAVANLARKPEYVLVDGYRVEFPCPSEAIIHGDRDVFPIACASIIAKVTRDRLMRNLEQHYPQYSFATHKGYGTKQHRREIHKNGLARIHRHSFHLKKLK